jgi:hypothetical protein
MRYVRRTLLCFVLGVTSFGAAGWAFRPRASWSFAIPDGRFHFAESETEATADRPLWLFAAGRGKKGYDQNVPGSVCSIAVDGSVSCRVSTPVGWPAVASDGSLTMAFNQTTAAGEGCRYSVLGIDGSLSNGARLAGRWTLTADALHAFNVERDAGGVSCHVIEIRSGNAVGSVKLNESECEFKTYSDIAVSRNGTFVAFLEKLVDGEHHLLLIRILNVSDGTLAAEISVEPGTRLPRGRAAQPRFSANSDTLTFDWRPLDDEDASFRGTFETGSSEYASFRPANRSEYEFDLAENDEARSGPPLPEGEAHAPNLACNRSDGCRIWTAACRDRNELWTCVDDGARDLDAWKRYPASVFVKRISFTYSGDPGPGQFWHNGPWLEFVPNRNAFLIAAVEPPVVDSLPEKVRSLLSENSALHRSQKTLRWRDWVKDSWRVVGDVSGLSEFQVREDRVFTLRHRADGMILQSWPLPPRDPKWPAMGVASGCVAATWWLCARRAKRKAAVVPT